MVRSKLSNAAPPLQFACGLSGGEFTERLRTVSELFAGSGAVRELADGYEFRFAATAERLRKLTEFVLEERTCCSFFQFELVFEPEQGPVWLRLRGARGVKAFVKAVGAQNRQFGDDARPNRLEERYDS